MESLLKHAWASVATDYREERINSERSLQASLYFWLRNYIGGKGLKLLVEPNFFGIPDLVIVSRRAVKCIIEIKCAPHYYVTWPKTRPDIEKLISYSRQKTLDLDLFGPRRQFDPQKKLWLTPKPKLSISDSTYFVFAAITRHDDNGAKLPYIESQIPAVRRIRHFIHLFGETYPETRRLTDRYRFWYQRTGREKHQIPLSA